MAGSVGRERDQTLSGPTGRARAGREGNREGNLTQDVRDLSQSAEEAVHLQDGTGGWIREVRFNGMELKSIGPHKRNHSLNQNFRLIKGNDRHFQSDGFDFVQAVFGTLKQFHFITLDVGFQKNIFALGANVIKDPIQGFDLDDLLILIS